MFKSVKKNYYHYLMATDLNNINELTKSGVTILKKCYNKYEIRYMADIALKIHTQTNTLLNSSIIPKCNYNYIRLYDKEYRKTKPCYHINDKLILEIEKGRLDIEIDNIFPEIQPIKSIINSFFTKDYVHTWGILTSDSKSVVGPWHRDVVNICGESSSNGTYDDSNMVHNFDPFYFTVLIPLVELNKNNGSPEFILESHKSTYNESIGKKHIQYDTELGDVIIFDGRIFHRGCANNSTQSRQILYIIYYRKWYKE